MSNTATVIGFLGANPELRYTPNGKAVASFNVGDTPRSFDRTANEWVNGETDWVSVTVWESLAENVAASLKKGDKVVVIGTYHAERYKDREQNERVAKKLRATEVAPSLTNQRASVEKQDRRPNNNGGGQFNNGNTGNQGTPATDVFSDDTPF